MRIGSLSNLNLSSLKRRLTNRDSFAACASASSSAPRVECPFAFHVHHEDAPTLLCVIDVLQFARPSPLFESGFPSGGRNGVLFVCPPTDHSAERFHRERLAALPTEAIICKGCVASYP